jgi:hypothetical protein
MSSFLAEPAIYRKRLYVFIFWFKKNRKPDPYRMCKEYQKLAERIEEDKNRLIYCQERKVSGTWYLAYFYSLYNFCHCKILDSFRFTSIFV